MSYCESKVVDMNKLLQQHFKIIQESSLFQSFYADCEDYREAPILRKHELVDTLKEKFDLSKEETGVYLVRSGGSSHKPLVFPVDIQENLAQRQKLAELLIKDGIFSSKTIALNLFSYKSMYRTAAIFDDILERCSATTLAFSYDASHDTVYEGCQDFQPNIILGTPSKLTLFAKYLKLGKKECNIKKVIYGGEFLANSQKKLLEETCNVQQIYSLYGSAETGIWAWSDVTHNPMHFHYLDEIVVEIIDPNEEGFGMIVVTNLLRKRFPLFRYNMGDIGKVVQKKGRNVLILAARQSNSLSLHSESYYLKDFEHLFNKVERFQIQLSLTDTFQPEVKVLLVNSVHEKELRNHIEEGIKEHLKINLNYTRLVVEYVDDNDLYADPVTSKTALIKDFRN
jgi:phenylacetate-CoA ligase